MLVYLNGEWVEDHDASVSFQDRGYVFADALYEVVHIYEGKIFKLDLHLNRMQQGFDKLRFHMQASELAEVFHELLNRNPHLERGMIYAQVSRGVAPRAHGIPLLDKPTVLAYAKPIRPDMRIWNEGGKAIFVEDLRWQMCNIKTTGLLLNCMAKQEALDKGKDDAIFHRGDIVTEASSSNVFMVKDGTLFTHPNGPWILPGITRHVVIELAKQIGIEVREEPFRKSDLLAADEMFLTGTISEVAPYIEIDENPIGNGKVGPVTRKIQEAFRKATGEG